MLFFKNKLNLQFVKIQTLLKKLRPYGIKEAYQGGKHPKKLVLPNGKSIPVPTHGKDIAKGTAHKILKDCEIVPGCVITASSIVTFELPVIETPNAPYVSCPP